MTWTNEPLNIYTIPPYIGDPNSPFGKAFNMGIDLSNKIVQATNTISSLGLNAEDMSGITLSQTSPTGITLTLPTAPTPISVTSPTIPDVAVTPTLTMDVVASDTLLNTLIAAIKSQLEYRLSNATGLNAAVELALFGRAIDRETELMATGYANYLANNSSLGDESAPGQDQFAFTYFEKQKKGKLSDINRDIMVKQAELEQTNVKDALNSLIQLNTGLESMKQADESNKIQLYSTREQVTLNHIEAFNKINQIAISLYAADVQAFQAGGAMTAAKAEFLVKQVEALNQLNANLTNLAVEKVKTTNAFTLGKYSSLVEANKAVGGTLGQLTSALFNTVNYSVGYSQHIGWSGSESLSA